MTTAFTAQEGRAAIFLAVDHCPLECGALHASRRGTRFEALKPIRHGVREYPGDLAPRAAQGLILQPDQGRRYISRDFQEEIAFPGIISSLALVRAPESNGCAARVVRILTENLHRVQTFATVEDLRQALLDFKRARHDHWIIHPHGYQTPAQVSQGKLQALPPAA
jgi:hypothetical protein